MMTTKLKSLFVLLALLVGGVNCAWADYNYDEVTYHFGTAASNNGTLIMSSMSYSGVSNTVYADKLTYTENNTEITEDISKLAFRSRVDATQGNRGWILAGTGLYCVGTGYTPELAICNLHSGDKVTITYTCNSQITYVNGAHGYYVDNNDNDAHKFSPIPSGQEITVSQNGDMIIKANDSYTYIQTIEIKTLQDVATYTVVTTKDNNNVTSTTFTFTGQGRMEDNIISVPFMDVQFGSNLNSPLVEPLGGSGDYYEAYTPDWNGHWHVWFDNNLPYQGTYYKFMPTARGKLQMNGFLSNGTIYLYEVDESNGTYTEKAKSLSTGTIMVPNNQWVILEKGKTYYVCDNPSSRDNNYFGLHSFTFNNEFDMNLSAVLANGATSGTLATVKGATTLESYTIKRVSGNINQSGINVSFAGSNSLGTLSISGISYTDDTKDKGGVIILDLVFDGGNATFVVTIPYSAEKGHIWNFYDTSKSTNAGSGPLVIGKYSDTSSRLYQETEAGKWKYTHRVINSQRVGTHDPMYQSVELMDGNNAAYIWETEGLIFNTPTLKACLYNENDLNATAYTDRYVGIMPGGSFTIPGLTAGDRVVIFMGSGDGSSNDVCFFNITGAQDAIGTNIDATKTYKAGGSLWNGDHGDYNLRGAYHFISKGGDMTFYMNGGSMTKIYSIEIYRGDHKFTVDATRTTATYQGTAYNAYTYQFLSTYKDNANTTKNACYQLHYRGKGDVLKAPVVLYSSGTVSTDASHLFYGTITSANGNVNPYIFYKSTPGEIGMFRMRIETIEQGTEAYVADYALQNITVGYLEKKTYPYTWDFTDLLSYSTSKITADITASDGYDQNKGNTEFMNRYSPIEENGPYYNSVALWKQYLDTYGGYGIQVRNNYYRNNETTEGSGELMFTSGSQLFAGSDFISEASGIGLTYAGSQSNRNGRLRITNEGLHLYEQDGTHWRVTIPEVPATSAVYVRVKEISDRGTPSVTVGDASTAFTYYKELSGKEYVYAVKGTGADMVIYFRNAIVQKIAVATDAKTVNKYGWNTESREHAIDPSLLPYMTGKDFRTYIVTAADREKNTVTLARIDGGSANDDNTAANMKLIVPGATKVEDEITVPDNGSKNACIIRYVDDTVAEDAKEVNLFGNGSGFHLFVPDMHDSPSEIPSTNLLKARVTATTDNDKVARDETVDSKTFNNYAFTYKYKKVDDSGNPYTGQKEGVQAFYRIVAGGARSTANKAYLSLEAPAASRASSRAAAASQAAESYDILFQEWDNIEQMKGDVNGDGRFNKLDVNTMADYVAGRPAGIFKGLADMNDDGNIDIVDMTQMINKIAGE